MTINLTENEKIVVEFLKMLEERQSPDKLENFYHPDAEQIEYPNAVVKRTTIRGIQELKKGSERGGEIMSKEEYEIRNLHSYADTVILEAIWKGTLSVPIGNIPVGGQLKAYFAQFFEFKHGKIFRQRNYDCFEPFN